GPDNSTLVMPQYLFRLAFSQNQFGYASAVGVAMAVVTLVFAGLVFTINRLTGGTTRSSCWQGRTRWKTESSRGQAGPVAAAPEIGRAPGRVGRRVLATCVL